MLEIKDLTIQYGEKDAVVENFSLTMQKGEIISIVGESGSGKSTVLRSIIGGLLGQGKVVSGDIIFNGKSLLHLSNNECAKFIKEMYTDKLKKVFLAHVSKDSNHLSIIKETLEDEFTGMLRKPNCEITSQDKVTKLFTIE